MLAQLRRRTAHRPKSRNQSRAFGSRLFFAEIRSREVSGIIRAAEAAGVHFTIQLPALSEVRKIRTQRLIRYLTLSQCLLLLLRGGSRK